MDDREVQALLAHFHLFDIDCLLRPATLEKSRLRRYLEDGASGLMIPHVSTAKTARQLVDAVKFPPLGERGLDGAGLDGDYLFFPAESYVDAADEQTFLVVQIETPLAIDNVDEIAAVEGVDALFVGTGDLGMRISRTNSELTIEDALAKVAAAARQHGKAWGCPARSPEHLRELYEQGGRLLAFGSDFQAHMELLQRCAHGQDEVFGA